MIRKLTINHFFRLFILSLTFVFQFIPGELTAQAIWVEPEQFTLQDDVKIYFDATKGNKALENCTGEVYGHMGLVLGTADDATGWRYVQGTWGVAEERMKFERVDANLYVKSLNIKSFFNPQDDDQLLQLAMVLRNADGTIVAKTADEKDIYFPELIKREHGYLEAINGKYLNRAGKVLSYKTTQDKSIFTCENGDLSISLDPQVGINISYGNVPKKREMDFNFKAGSINFQLEADRYVSIIGDHRIEVLVENGNVILAKQNGEVLNAFDIFYKNEENGESDICGVLSMLNENEHIYGSGSRALEIDRRQRRLYNYNQPNYGYEFGEDDVYLSLPIYISSKNQALIFENHQSSYADIGKSQFDKLEFASKANYVSFYYLIAENLPDLSQKMGSLMGKQEIPPIWSLGYIQSRYGYKSRKELEEITYKTLEEGFPVDAICMDLFWFGGNLHMGDLQWDREQFPKPEEMVEKLNSKGVKTILITESYVVDSTIYYQDLVEKELFAKDKNGDTYLINDFWVAPASLLDVFHPGVADWFWHFYKKQIEKGVAGFWCDSGEPENHPKKMFHVNGSAEEIHNLYALKWAEILYEKHKEDYPDKRFFNLMRSGYPGMQKYSTFPWSGDVRRSWSALKAQVPIMLGTGLCGVGYIHHDAGGFMGSVVDEELYTRWVQLGVFSPILRIHGDASMIQPEPIFFSDSTKEIVKEAIKLRYELLPYNYHLAYENNQFGYPLMRQMNFHYPNDPKMDTLNYQFMWGSDILFAPVLDQSQTSLKVYLGSTDKWYDWKGSMIETDMGYAEVKLGMNDMALFVKAGAFIPRTPDLYNTESYVTGSRIHLDYYYSTDDSSSNLYSDDGISRNNFENGQYELWSFEKRERDNQIEINIKQTNKSYSGKLNQCVFKIFGLNKSIKSVSVNGIPANLSDMSLDLDLSSDNSICIKTEN